jgi:hypothetical protein
MERVFVECFSASVRGRVDDAYFIVLHSDRIMQVQLPKERHGKLKQPHVCGISYTEADLCQDLIGVGEVKVGSNILLHLTCHDQVIRWELLSKEN